jgi:hypothetical protein
MDIGGAVNDPRNLTVIEDVGPDGPAAMRSAAIAEQPVGDNMAVAAAPAPAASGGGGSGYSGPPVATFNAPRVVIGNGRTPGTQLPTPGPPPVVHAPITAPAPQLAPIAPVPDEVPTVAPPVPLAADINVPPLPPPLPPVEHIGPADFVVAEFGTGTTVTVTDPLAGVAGLILIPAIGAVLGYRQARGAQTLRESLRR